MGGGSRGWVRGRCLGRGSTAAVYLAAPIFGDRESFAVKSAELSRSAPLQREKQIMSTLCSPHVVSCFGEDVTAEPDGRVLYNLFMEYVPGGSLADAIKQHGGLDERASTLYTRGILEGLAYLHSRGIVHCDVKGHNILLGEDDSSVKLADFGCARRVDGCDDGGSISGTPLYMAPEVARGEGQGPAADIWALGCTLIEMATGCPPWPDVDDPVAAIHRIAFSVDVPEIPCNISGDARDFLGRCLDRDPRKRWSAGQLQDHPFVNSAQEFTTECSEGSRWRSPKSTLDQVFWDSWEEGDEEEDEARRHLDDQLLESVTERLRQLAGGGVSPPPAAGAEWDVGGWVTVRNNVDCGGRCMIPSEVQPLTSCSCWAGEAVGVEDSSASYCGGSVRGSSPSSPCLLFSTVEHHNNHSCTSRKCLYYVSKYDTLVHDYDYDIRLKTSFDFWQEILGLGAAVLCAAAPP